jgi:DHA1 family bicyclomycin/chloramphenicol resistance-like MFS transporter
MIKLALVLLVLFCPLAIDLYLPAMPKMANAMNASMTSIQSSITLYMLCVGLMQLVFGPLSDRYGRRKIALLGIFAYLIGALIAAVSDSVVLLLIARIIQGTGAAATFVSTFAIVRDNYNANKSAQALSYLNGMVCFIPALAPILGAWLTLNFGWQSNFFFLAGYAAFCIPVLFVALSQQYTQCHKKIVKPKVSYWQIFSHAKFLFNASICMIAMSAILAFVAQAPNYLMQEKGLNESDFTFWFSLNASVSIISSFLAPQLIKRAANLTLMAGLLLMTLSGTLLILTNIYNAQISYFMIAIFVGSVGFSLVLGAAAGNALEPFKNNAGKASALLGMMQMSGAGALVTLSQFLPIAIPLIIALHLLVVIPFLVRLLRLQLSALKNKDLTC